MNIMTLMLPYSYYVSVVITWKKISKTVYLIYYNIFLILRPSIIVMLSHDVHDVYCCCIV